MDRDPTPLPDHIEETVRAVTSFHVEHELQATRIQKGVDGLTALFGRPAFISLLTVAVTLWMAVNIVLPRYGRPAFDPPPYIWLQGILTLLAVYMTSFILTSQRRADRLAARREQLTLELSIVAEQKTAKVIQLLEEMRRDNPLIGDRVDREADAMSTPSDPQQVLDAIKEHQPLAEETPPPADAPASSARNGEE